MTRRRQRIAGAALGLLLSLLMLAALVGAMRTLCNDEHSAGEGAQSANSVAVPRPTFSAAAVELFGDKALSRALFEEKSF